MFGDDIQTEDPNVALPDGYKKGADGQYVDRLGRPVDPAIMQSWFKMRGQLPNTYKPPQQQPQAQSAPTGLNTPKSTIYPQGA
jgi:hypothetical protein